MRVCTTVAIAIVAETCSPFTVLPALMNEYRIPDLNVQNGVLKALSFMFEYIGEMGRDYIYSVSSLLEDSLMDRDVIHRQTASTTVKHIALGVSGLDCEDALLHLMNFVWPNILEVSPHVINAVMEAVEGLIVALGPGRIFMYALQGLYHPARKFETPTGKSIILFTFLDKILLHRFIQDWRMIQSTHTDAITWSYSFKRLPMKVNC